MKPPEARREDGDTASGLHGPSSSTRCSEQGDKAETSGETALLLAPMLRKRWISRRAARRVCNSNESSAAWPALTTLTTERALAPNRRVDIVSLEWSAEPAQFTTKTV
mmetsp:Transcript_6682/g.15894  ORF Transcript_6682/g.15894 Transcript_6682/m.15894 type:complete len:108 (-) Transcript_6682:971-1294(-)